MVPGANLDQSHHMLLPGPNTAFDPFSIPFSELSDISPIGLDMGPFMAGIEWESFV